MDFCFLHTFQSNLYWRRGWYISKEDLIPTQNYSIVFVCFFNNEFCISWLDSKICLTSLCLQKWPYSLIILWTLSIPLTAAAAPLKPSKLSSGRRERLLSARLVFFVCVWISSSYLLSCVSFPPLEALICVHISPHSSHMDPEEPKWHKPPRL